MKNIFVISGPSGVGKSTLIDHILLNIHNARLSISCTTRLPRYYERNGKEYYFLSKTEFQASIQSHKFIEYTTCFGNYYGTLKSEVQRILDDTGICILDIEFEGAYNVLEKYSFGKNVVCTGILIIPPSIHELKRRLIARGSENIHSIEVRLEESFDFNKIAYYEPIYGYVITNSDLNESKSRILAIVNSKIKQ